MASTASLIAAILTIAVAAAVLHALAWRLWRRWPPRDRVRRAGLPLTAVAIAATVALALLGGLIDGLGEAAGVVRLDAAANHFFAAYRAPWLLTAFLWVTALGAGPAVTAVAVTASALCWSQGRARLLAPLWISFLGAQAMTWAGKYLFQRPRPEFIDVATAASPSFPSGHATATTALFGFLAYVVARDLPAARPRFEVGFWAASLIALVCFSRIFLSLHFLSDILAGVLVGGFWLLAGIAIAERARPGRGLQPGRSGRA